MAAQVATPSSYIPARLSLLEREKAATRALDAVATERRSLPIVPLTKTYTFTASDGSTKTLADLFEGEYSPYPPSSKRQLIMYHFMFPPSAEQGCNSCSTLADHIPHLSHLHSRDTAFAVVSRTPIDKINAFQKRMGWTDRFPWYSSHGGEFNFDFHVSKDADDEYGTKVPVEYNYKSKEELEGRGMRFAVAGEQPGLSCFLMGRSGDGGRVKEGQIYHTYSSYARGVEVLLGTYALLDLTHLGRQDGPGGVMSFQWHDRYD